MTEPHSSTLTSLHLRHSSFSNPSAALPTSQLILQPFRCFTYIIGTSPTSQLILQPYCCFTYITAHSTALPLLHLCHSSLSNPSAASSIHHSSFCSHSIASPTSQALHVLHLVSCPWYLPLQISVSKHFHYHWKIGTFHSQNLFLCLLISTIPNLHEAKPIISFLEHIEIHSSFPQFFFYHSIKYLQSHFLHSCLLIDLL